MDEGSEPSFVCERVCTSERLMRRMGGLAKVSEERHGSSVLLKVLPVQASWSDHRLPPLAAARRAP